jgi:hypothetical protein
VQVSKRRVCQVGFAFMCVCTALGWIADFKNTIGLGI